MGGPEANNFSTNASENSDVTAYSDITHQIERAKTLLAEIDALYGRLRSVRKENVIVGIAGFRKAVQCELSALNKLSLRTANESTTHMSRSSNLKFWEGVWSTAKRSTDLIAVRKRVSWNKQVAAECSGRRPINSLGKPKLNLTKHSTEKSVVIDVVADGGKTWTKVSMATNNSLLFDLAKLGWESSGSEITSDDEHDDFQNELDQDRSVPILKSVKSIIEASKLSRVRTENPLVQVVFPRITRGDSPHVDAILRDCEDCGAMIICRGDRVPQATFEASLNAMARNPILDFTDTLNLDCTVLVALLSDISHMKVANKASFHPDIQRQVQSENQDNLLSSLLYPALRNRKLVCTKEAAECMRRIVERTGTSTEKARMAIFMGDDSSKTQIDLVERLARYSIHEVPLDLKLPIMIVDQDEFGCQSGLPSSAKDIGDVLSPINKSIFLYGWASGLTTITSNRRILKLIESNLERYDNTREWPDIWLCPVARSLLGEEHRDLAEIISGEQETRVPDVF